MSKFSTASLVPAAAGRPAWPLTTPLRLIGMNPSSVSTQPLAPGAANELSTKIPSSSWMMLVSGVDGDFRFFAGDRFVGRGWIGRAGYEVQFDRFGARPYVAFAPKHGVDQVNLDRQGYRFFRKRTGRAGELGDRVKLQSLGAEEVDQPIEAGDADDPTGDFLFGRQQAASGAGSEVTEFFVDAADEDDRFLDWHVPFPICR